MEKKDEKKKTPFQEFLEETQKFPGETKRSVLSAGAVEYIHLNKRVEELIKPFWPNIQSKPETFPPTSHNHVHELTGSDHTVSGLIPGSVLAAITENMIGFRKVSELAEVDPVFMASAAHGIAAGDITNWNTAYGWGNHAGLYTPLAHKTTEDAINGLVFVNGAGTYSAKAIGTDVQAYNSELAAIAAGTWVGKNSITTLGSITTGGWHGTTIAIDHGGTGATTAALAATALGLGTGDSPVFATVKLSDLIAGYIPYHIADATGFGDSPLYRASATQLVLGSTSPMTDPASPGFTIASTTDAGLGLVATALAGFGSYYLRNSLGDKTWCMSIRDQAGAYAFQIGHHDGSAWQAAYFGISTAGVVSLGSLAGLLKGTAGVVSAVANTTAADYMGGDAAYHTLNQAAVDGLKTTQGPSFAHIHATDEPATGGALITAAESWIGPSATTGIYFKGGYRGMGTTNPLYELHIATTNASGYMQFETSSGSFYLGMDAYGGNFGTAAAIPFYFYTNNISRLKILGTGEVLIWATAAIGTEKFRCDGDAYFDHDVSALTFTDRP